MIEISDNVFVDPKDVAAVEEHIVTKYLGSFSDSYPVKDFEGSRIILKNGRKIYVRETPKIICAKLGLLK